MKSNNSKKAFGIAGIALSASALALWADEGAQDAEEFLDDEAWFDALFVSDEEDDLVIGLEDDSEGIGEALSLTGEDLNAPLSSWIYESSFSGSLGWKDNVLYSSTNPVDSVFERGEFEFFAMKPAAGESLELLGLLFGDIRRYEDVEGFSTEYMAVLHAHAARKFQDGGKAIATFEGTRSKQAFDASVNDFETAAIVVDFWRPNFELAYERPVGEWGLFGLRADVAKSSYSEESEDYDERALRVDWLRPIGKKHRLSAGVERFVESYDQRLERSSSEELADAPLLEVVGVRWNADWTFTPAEGVMKRLRSRVSYRLEDDRVGDYYEKDSWQFRQSALWAWGDWKLETGYAFGTVDYAARPAVFGEEAPRSDESWRWDAEITRKMGKNIELFSRIEVTDKDSNAGIYSYDSKMARIGLRWESGE